MKRILLAIIFILVFNSCVYELSNEPELGTDFDFYLKGFILLNDAQQAIVNGIYDVMNDRDNNWSDKVVCKYVKNRLCIYSSDDVVYAENLGGFLGDSLEYSGIMRIVRSGKGCRMKLVISDTNTVKYLRDGINPKELLIKAFDENGHSLTLSKNCNLKEMNDFLVIAHRGGCRNSERIGISENSLEMIEYAEILGADGVEIDVKKTKDDKLIIFHDDTFSPRTVQGAYLLGKVKDFTFNQISTFGRLIYGEKIPTLEEALQTVVNKTKLKLVWLDLKDESDETITQIFNLQKKFSQMTSPIGRKLLILLGLPSENALDLYDNNKNKNLSDILIESDTTNLNRYSTCRVWAPRWTVDIKDNKNNGIAEIKGIQIFRWTVDLQSSIEAFIENKNDGEIKLNGLLSNYPTLVNAIKYTYYLN